MSSFSLSADAIVEMLALLAALACFGFAARAALARKFLAALALAFVGAFAVAVLYFFLTFRIAIL